MKANKSRPQRCALSLAAGAILGAICPTVASPPGQIAVMHVSQENYRHYLDDMLYTHLGDDRSRNGPEHIPARDNIVNIFTSFGLDVILHLCEDLEGNPHYSVVATKLGTTYPDQHYIVGGHYDSPDLSPEPSPGADDNASGVASILEAARVLSAYPSAYTIKFIAFDLEEHNFGGSAGYVQDHINDDIVRMIAVDLVAWNYENEDSIILINSSINDELMQLIEDAANIYGDGLKRAMQTTLRSDFLPFEEAGFSAVWLAEAGNNSGVGSRWPHIHAPTDSVDTPDYIDYEFATKITRSVVGFLVDHALVDVTPPDGDYNDDGEVDMLDFAEFEACFSGMDVRPVDGLCAPGDFDVDRDIDCTDFDALLAAWTGPVDPLPEIELCTLEGPQPAPWPDDARKNRYVSFAPCNAGPAAFEVEMSASGEFPDSTGLLGWVGEPDDNDVSRIVSDPYISDAWPALVHVGDCRIVPVATYVLRSTPDGVTFVRSLDLGTILRPDPWFYGDTAGVGTGDLPPLPGFTPPNQIVNVNDVTAYLLTAKGDTTPSAHTTWVDLHGLGDGAPPNYLLNVSDLQRILFGLEGQLYGDASDQLDPADCP
ncbi:MAG: M28 family peptidase [Phycisphaerales bacterium]|nr:MAG: M28 family peptidase [Phycisphaerales bacterium]